MSLLSPLGLLILATHGGVEGYGTNGLRHHQDPSSNGGSEEDVDDDDNDSNSNVKKQGIIPQLLRQEKKELVEDWSKSPSSKACVSLLVYRESECSGDPVGRLTVPTWTEAGSPCLDMDLLMSYSSVKDQYCDLESGIWYETVYPFSRTCETHWYNFWSVAHLEFQQGDCIGGFELEKPCKKGRCRVEKEDGTPVYEDLVGGEGDEDGVEDVQAA